jgi:hypothetical protein
MVQIVPFQDLTRKWDHGNTKQFSRSGPEVVKPFTHIVVFTYIYLRCVIKGYKMSISRDVLTGTKKYRFYGKACQVPDPLTETFLKGFTWKDTAPWYCVGILLDLSHEKYLPIRVYDDNSCETLDSLFHVSVLPRKT